MRKRSVLLLASVFAFGVLYSCTATEPESSSSVKEPTVWTEDAMTKVLADKHYTGRSTQPIRLGGAGGETECGQVIISPEKDISEYTVSVSPLQMGNEEIPKEAIELYHQKYINIPVSTSVHEAGWYPDALLPMDIAVEYEENYVQAGKNQGILFEVSVPNGISSGVYCGEILVTVDGEEYKIPVELEKYGFDLSEENHAKSAFLLTGSFVGSSPDLYPNDSPELYENYYNDLLEYRISPHSLPAAGTTPESVAAAAKKAATNPKISSYSLPYQIITDTSSLLPEPHRTINKALITATLKKLVEESTKETDLLKKAYYYVGGLIDEPTGEKYDLVREIDEIIQSAKEEVAAMNLFEGKENVRESLLNVQHIVTSKITESLYGEVDSWCSPSEYFSGISYRYQAEQRKESGDGLWWYTCMLPKAPMPSYHIDGTMLEHRIIGWQQIDYGVEGNLYWCVNKYNKTVSGADNQPRDVWNDAYAYPGAPGDGFLTYPGARYGLNTFVPTLRLFAIRDGYEDYEYLWLLRDLIEKANAKYGSAFDFELYVDELSAELYENSVPFADGKTFRAIRRRLASMIELLNSEANVLVSSSLAEEANLYKIEIRAEKDAAISVDGKRVAVDGGYAVATIPLSDTPSNAKITVACKSGEISMDLDVPGKFERLAGFEDEAEFSKIKTSSFGNLKNVTAEKNIEKTYVKGGNSSLKITVEGSADVPLTYTPYVRLTRVPKDFSAVKTVTFKVYNSGEEMLILQTKLRKSDSAKTLSRTVCEAGEWSWVTVALRPFEDFDYKDITALEFAFESSQEETVRTVYIDELFIGG